MATYVMLSRLHAGAFSDPSEFKTMAATVKDHIKKDCPDIDWKKSFAVMGRYDVVDIVECDDPAQVKRAAMIVNAYGHSATETMPATEWDRFLEKI